MGCAWALGYGDEGGRFGVQGLGLRVGGLGFGVETLGGEGQG